MEIRIKRISKYDSFKADELLKDLEKELKETLHHLKHLTDYAISYFTNLLNKYGKGRERKTEIKSFQSVTATEVIANNQKLYVNREDGFAGWGLRKDEFIADCSELDDVIVIRKDGKALISRIGEKKFMGKDIIHVSIWRKGDERMIYNLIYSDGKTGASFAKRFAIPGVTRDKEYDLTSGNPNSKLHYLSANPNGEAEIVEVKLSQASTARKKIFDFDFTELEVKGRGVKGNVVTKYPVRKVDFKEGRGSTLSGLKLWFDQAQGRLNKYERGKYVNKFDGEDKIIAITTSGNYKITKFELTNRYEPEKTILVEKFNPKKVISAIYWDGQSKQYFVKRFTIETNTFDKDFNFISEGIGSRLEYATTAESPELEIEVVKGKGGDKKLETVNLEELVDVKGWKAVGNRLSEYKVTKVIKPEEEPADSGADDSEDESVSTPAASGEKKKMKEPLSQPSKKTAKPASLANPKKSSKVSPSSAAKSSKQKLQSKKSPSKPVSSGKAKAVAKKAAPKKKVAAKKKK